MPGRDHPTTSDSEEPGQAAPAGVDEPSGGSLRIGVVSDTHGYLDPAILDALAGVDLILHAGDIGDATILDALRSIAPVTAVAGNLDDDTMGLPTEVAVDAEGVRLALGHKRKRLVKRLAGGTRFDLVVFGHEHIPSVAWVEGTLWLNPGSASAPYEEDETPTIAIVERVSAGLGVRFIPLARRAQQPPAPPLKQGKGKAGRS
jgi:putative phosphoesterase